MTKAQRARLLVLQSLAAEELTAAQKTELATLTQLATANPDATKDTDAPAAAVATPPVIAAKPSVIRNAAAVISAAANKIRNGASAAIVAATDLATANQTIATVTGERETARVDLVTARATIASLNTQVQAFADFLGLKPADLAGKDAVALNSIFEEKLNASLLDHVGSMGLPTGKLPKKTEGNGQADLADLMSEYAALAAKDSIAAAQYYQANIEPLQRAAQRQNIGDN